MALMQLMQWAVTDSKATKVDPLQLIYSRSTHFTSYMDVYLDIFIPGTQLRTLK